MHGTEYSYTDSAMDFQYATSMHWAVAQTTLGAMEINACNTLEFTATNRAVA